MKVPGGPLLNQNLFSFCFPLFYFNNFFLPNYSSSNKKMMFIMEGMLSKALSSQYWPAISMDWIVEAGQKVKDPNARLISPEALSIHMECHNLSNRMIKTFFKTRKKKNSNRVRFRQSFIENTNLMWLVLPLYRTSFNAFLWRNLTTLPSLSVSLITFTRHKIYI